MLEHRRLADRRITWIQEALEPLRGQLPEEELRRLVHAIGTVVGIEALVWLTDIAGLPHQQAAEVMRWSAQALLRAAVADADAAQPQGAPITPTTRQPRSRQPAHP